MVSTEPPGVVFPASCLTPLTEPLPLLPDDMAERFASDPAAALRLILDVESRRVMLLIEAREIHNSCAIFLESIE